jgi:hypothetical protein
MKLQCSNVSMAAGIFETLKIETFIENWSLKIENL